MSESPLVTVNILSFNRKDELRHTLQKVYEQDYKNIEVIVVDNASSDESPKMVKNEFPDVILVQLEKNVGIAGWNEGFKIAKGEYVLVLDDDAYPEKDAILLAVYELKNKANVGIVALNIYNIYKDNIDRFPGGWLPQTNIVRCYWNYFVGCAFIIRFGLFINNLFPISYFICFHEIPITRYVFQSNYSILYDKRIRAYHINQVLQVDNPLKECYHFRNMLNFLLWNFAIPFNLFYGMRVSIYFLFRSIRRNWFKFYLGSFSYQNKNLQGYSLRKMDKKKERF